MGALRPFARTIKPTRYAPDGIQLEGADASLFTSDIFQAGEFAVQDEAAQLVCWYVHPKPGELVLDACAGLGTKTGLLAQIMQNRGKIIAVDHHKDKLIRLQQEMNRLSVVGVVPRNLDLNRPLKTGQLTAEGNRFDRVLLDAPCSGLGVLRRNPDAKWKAGRQFRGYQNQQIRLLNHLAPWVKPAGVMVYSVCSTEPEENEAVIDKFLSAHPEFSIEDAPRRLPYSLKGLRDPGGGVKTFPHRHGMDGFFFIRLKKIAKSRSRIEL
jgi:16S rRNA (cytosine967-C5)-methyltransferase